MIDWQRRDMLLAPFRKCHSHTSHSLVCSSVELAQVGKPEANRARKEGTVNLSPRSAAAIRSCRLVVVWALFKPTPSSWCRDDDNEVASTNKQVSVVVL